MDLTGSIFYWRFDLPKYFYDIDENYNFNISVNDIKDDSLVLKYISYMNIPNSPDQSKFGIFASISKKLYFVLVTRERSMQLKEGELYGINCMRMAYCSEYMDRNYFILRGNVSHLIPGKKFNIIDYFSIQRNKEKLRWVEKTCESGRWVA